MNTKYDLDFLESRWAAHFSSKEKKSLKEKFSKQRENILFFKKKKIFAPPPQVNDIDYHQILNAEPNHTILIVGGEGKSVFPNSKTFNLYPGAHANVTGDIARTCFKDETFDVVFFERIGFCKSVLKSKCISAKFNSLKEAYRILKPNGRLVLITGILYEKIVEDFLNQEGKWSPASEMKILNSELPIDKFAKITNEFVYNPLHFLRRKEINDKK
jgi:SAM-dependent methyltransferase